MVGFRIDKDKKLNELFVKFKEKRFTKNGVPCIEKYAPEVGTPRMVRANEFNRGDVKIMVNIPNGKKIVGFYGTRQPEYISRFGFVLA